MIQYLAIMLTSQTTNLAMSKTLEVLQKFDLEAPTLERLRYVSGNLKAYGVTPKCGVYTQSSSSQRDAT